MVAAMNLWMRRWGLAALAALALSGCGGSPSWRSPASRSSAQPDLPPPPDTPVAQGCDDEGAFDMAGLDGFQLPLCIETAEGVMSIEGDYLPGVVECELGGAYRAPAALRAQAVAARTYLMAHLKRRKRRGRPVKIGPHFQCWKPAKRDSSRQAVVDTAGVIMVRGGQVLDSNYVSGTRYRGADCAPEPPEESGYDYDTWLEMRRAYYRSKKRGRRLRFKGRFWTEILVTYNSGRQGDEVEGTPMAPSRATNRGAMSQYGAVCYALRRGMDAPDILRQYYGQDVGFYGAFRPGAPTAPAPDEEIPDLEPEHEPLPELDLNAL